MEGFNMSKSRKNQKGFTLVEVIVVAVIVAILAAVAIPLYNGYIADSRINVCQNTAASVASAFTAAVQQDPSFDGTDFNALTTITIPAQSGVAADASVITLPTGYTIAITATTVTVTHTASGKSSTAVPYRS
jgi:prepilin-type N-terminal cleavage/methylation domain-containing protein